MRVMIDRAYVQRMARYNRWQNEICTASPTGCPSGRRERGAFGSIQRR